MKRKRLDMFIVDMGLVPSREVAKRVIMSGMVRVNSQKILKPSYEVREDDVVELLERPKYVSRGGYKLEGALEEFGIEVFGKVCLDVGASTGGFTDCLLKRGAKIVYAVDVGKGQLDLSLRNNPKVIVYERTNARYLDKFVEEGKVKFEEKPEVVTIDVSFISVEKIILPVSRVVSDMADFIVLIKPQFELGPRYVSRGGIVREEYHPLAVEKVKNFVKESGFRVIGVTLSKLKGSDGNQEYFIYFTKARS